MNIKDEQWNRSSSSWKRLKPKKFNCIDKNNESVSDYCRRIEKVITVPEEVAKQWLYIHYYNGNTVDNYGWIDYSKAMFECVTVTTENAINLRVIEDYSDYVQTRKQGTPFKDFMCNTQDKEYWIQKRTWRIPPIIVDVKSFSNPPPFADFSGFSQLVEGHSRLGYLLSMHRVREELKEQHRVYVLRAQRDV
ncbi:MAG: hypothetical protein OEM02_12060 [Desulfobulbaceae bacterium]|nr:hypothetical protein [Desulfobulbaceae bacterium]